jgi:HPt (histidine-containing phosphotransfer) domain-containing protein
LKSTSGWPRLNVPAGPNDPFDDLRASYYERLRSERLQLIELHAQLSRPELGPIALYETIYLVAHGMAGAAAIFGVAEVLSAASALERAAIAMTKAPEDGSGPTLDAALQALTDLLQGLCA